jgi:hypothetical protein
MAGRRTVRRQAMSVLARLVCGMVPVKAGHAPRADDAAARNAQAVRLRSCYAFCLSALICIAITLTAGRWSDQAFPQDVRSTTTTALSSSIDRSVAGQPATFTAKVTGPGGVPTGVVIFKDGPQILGTVSLSADGSATFTTSALAPGSHAITADYGGDGRFDGSTSSIRTHAVQPTGSLPAGLLLLVVIVLLATLLLLRRLVFPLVARLIRALWRTVARTIRTLARPVVRLLRSLRIISRVPPDAQSTAAMQSVVGLSTVALAQAFSGETEEAIARNFDTESVKIERHKQFFCTWLAPQAIPHVIYEKERAEEALNSAKSFFIADIPIESNALNVYDDIDGAFIVNLLSDSDKACFHVLSEFKKTITGNVIVLAILFSLIVSVVAVANLLFSTSIDIYSYSGLATHLPYELDLRVTTVNLDVSKDIFNKMIFGSISCMAGYILMWFYYQTEYAQFQRYNGQQMNNFLVEYLANININFRQIHTNATQTILEEKDVDAMRHDATLWITHLQWMAFRAFFIEQFLKNTLFQVRRNSSYYLFIIPILFILAMLGTAYAFGIHQLNVFDSSSEAYRQNTFYLFFTWLLLTYYGYLSKSISFVWQSIEARRWFKFRELNLQEAMTRIMDSYVVQLDRWRSMMKSRG